MSSYSEKIEGFLRKLYPSHTLIKEYYVFYTRQRLLFDFYLPEFRLMIEVQGEQHYSFNKFFHREEMDFKKQAFRDSQKVEYCKEKNLKLLSLHYKDIEEMDLLEFKRRLIEAI